MLWRLPAWYQPGVECWSDSILTDETVSQVALSFSSKPPTIMPLVVPRYLQSGKIAVFGLVFRQDEPLVSFCI